MTENNVEAGIVGTFVYDVYENADRTWCVYKYRDADTDKEFTAVGSNLPKQKNLPVKLCGTWTTNKKTGKKQFSVAYTEQVRPTSRREVVAYLVSLKCGVGKLRAAAIYAKFGERTWDVIDNHPEQLKKVVGISETTCTRLIKAIADDNVTRVLIGSLSKAGIAVSGATLHKIVEKFGGDTMKVLTNNPYEAYGIEGFSFDKCDALAFSVGIKPDDPKRLRALVRRVLHAATINGHVCLPKLVLLNEMIKYSGCSRNDCIDAINGAFTEKDVCSAGGYVYLPEEMACEKLIAKSLVSLIKSGTGPITGLDDLIAHYEATHFQLAESQRDAIKMVFENQVSIITGGPGTGKTTVTNAVLWVHRELFGDASNPLLLAPTGKAARRLSEATNYPAATIHSAVGWRGEDAEVECETTMLEGNLVLIDESSMMDQKIASILLERIELGARVVFIGDVDQLPSVGCGYVLHDMIVSGVIPTTRLTVIYRQSGNNPIIVNSHRINNGNADLIETKSFRFIETSSDGEAFSEACKLYLRCVKAYGDDAVVLLNPQRNNTDLSVDNFNLKLQAILNPPREGSIELKVGKVVFRAGDKVMETKNTDAARNGDVGHIREIYKKPDPEDPSEWQYFAAIEFDGNNGSLLEYTEEELRHITHAWCMTVHKVQGSEYPTVIQVVSKAHPSMLQKRLVYTGVTRARNNVALIGERDALRIAVANSKEAIRYTLLAQRIKKALS